MPLPLLLYLPHPLLPLLFAQAATARAEFIVIRHLIATAARLPSHPDADDDAQTDDADAETNVELVPLLALLVDNFRVVTKVEGLGRGGRAAAALWEGCAGDIGLGLVAFEVGVVRGVSRDGGVAAFHWGCRGPGGAIVLDLDEDVVSGVVVEVERGGIQSGGHGEFVVGGVNRGPDVSGLGGRGRPNIRVQVDRCDLVQLVVGSNIENRPRTIIVSHQGQLSVLRLPKGSVGGEVLVRDGC